MAAVNIILTEGALRLVLASRTRGAAAERILRAALIRATLRAPTRTELEGARLARVAFGVLASGGVDEPSGFTLCTHRLGEARRDLHVDVEHGIVREVMVTPGEGVMLHEVAREWSVDAFVAQVSGHVRR